MTTGTRRVGELCWFNILTPQPAEARAFFATLLRWTYAGPLVRVGDHPIGALHDLAHPMTPPGTPPLVGLMVKVESADAAREKVIALGGRAKPAFDIMDQGRMSVCHDPCGAELDVWEPRALPGTLVDSRRHGAPSWFEARVPDVARASAFYAELFGWSPEIAPLGATTYTTFSLDGTPVAGMLAVTPRMGSIPPHWATYFTVDDAEAAAQEAVRLGATISLAMREVPGMGRFCGITSPQGVPFQIVQYTG